MNGDRARALRRRIEDLSDSQRAALAEALVRTGSVGAPERLVGFVVPNDPESPSDSALRSFLAARLPEYMIPAKFVALERLPRTAAGKLDRHALARSTASEPAAASASPAAPAPLTPTEGKLVAIWRDVLKVDDVGVDDDFFEIGGDSLLSIRVIARAGRDGIRVSPERFFERPTIRHMATTFDVAAAGGSAIVGRPPLTDAVGEAPLTPIQHWFLDAIPQHRDWWNQSYLLELGHPLDAARLRDIVQLLVAHHDALRLRLARRDGRWRQEFVPVGGDPPFRVVRLGAAEREHLAARLSAEGDREHASLRAEDGRLFRCVYFEGEWGWRRILLLGHHLVLDGVSWQVILEDLATLVTQAARGEALRLPEQTAPARAWALGLGERAATTAVREMSAYWGSMPGGEESHGRAAGAGNGEERDAPAGTNADAATVTLTLGADESRSLLEEAPRRLVAPVQALLLAALLVAWGRWSGADSLHLDMEGHGRDVLGDAFDVSRTVGWFTTVFPLRLALPAAADGAAVDAALVVSEVKRALDALPMRGAAHGLLRYLSPDESTRAALAEQPRPRVLFNHLGDYDLTLPPAAGLRVTGESHGRARSPDGARAYPLELNSRVERGVLIVTIEYARHAHGAEGVERFATMFRESLRAVATALPARFGLAGLDASTLRAVAGLIDDLDED